MSEPLAFGPYRFALTDEEARIAIARLALKYGLSSRFERDYVAPLVLFVLLLGFVAILAFTGLIGRRIAEAALLLGAVLFLSARFVVHWRLRRAQRLAKGVVEQIAAAGETSLIVDDGGLAVTDREGCGQQPHSALDLMEIENAGGLFYLWPAKQDAAPLIVPARVFANGAEAERFIAFLRGRMVRPVTGRRMA